MTSIPTIRESGPPVISRGIKLPLLMASRRIEFALACAVVFFAPINVLRLEAFYFTVSDALACLCLGLMLLNRSAQLRPFGPGTAFWLFGLAVAMGGLMASSLLAGAEDRGVILLLQYVFAYFVLPVILLARPWSQATMLIKVFIASITIMVVHGIYVVDIVGEYNTVFVSGSRRLQGFVERENECGSLIALTIPLLLSLVGMGALRPVYALLLAPLLTYGLMLTGSNTALYAMLLGLGLIFLANFSVKRLIFALCTLQLLWLAINMPAVQDHLPAAFRKRVLTGLSTGELSSAGTFRERMALNEEAFHLAGDALWLGYGADQYREISAWKTPVHNLYLLMWNEGGLIALAGLVLMLAGAVVVLVSVLRYRNSRPVFICGFVTLSLFAMLMNAVPHVYGRFWAVPVLLSIGPAVAFLNARASREAGLRRAASPRQSR
ncbi:O-antigen ligase family protein [Rhodoligotrophos defluvii]|uniref:O-antigen ligase family protein n=1 Tax=Rhodoligotrophos defluvii TaxID=2561934 RepID=UPI0010C94EE1|nr:O-antigen ligase family protein [Rhodoligotrophos defluvii]